MKKFILLLLTLLATNTLVAQQEERRIWPDEYAPKNTAVSKPKNAHTYKNATPKVVVENVAPDTVVGVTIWRLTPMIAASSNTKIRGNNMDWIAERVEAGTPLSKGDHVRLSIEAARDGYMYVINRERYADGSYGDPYMIFPTSRLAHGENRTSVGRVFEIPAQTDRPPYFTLSPGRANQVAEVLSVLITPEPMNDLIVTDQPLHLSAEMVAQWEQKWGKSVGRLEMENGAGQEWTYAEKQAGMGARLLKHEDPSPQSVYFNPDVKSGDPSFINIDLQYQK